MREPLIPRQGDEVKASTIADIINWVRSIVPRGDGKTIRVKTTNGGSTITSFGTDGTLQNPILIGAHLHYSSTLQKIVYSGFYCSDYDGVFCTTWVACYLVPIYNVTPSDYSATPTAWDFTATTILFGQPASINLFDSDPYFTTGVPVYTFDHSRWL